MILKFYIKRAIISSAVIFLIVTFFVSCSGRKQRVALGFSLIKEGKFDTALQVFQREYQKDSKDPELLAGFGYVLSLRRASIISSMDMLERSLSVRPDSDVRRELIILYMDAGLYEQAKRLIAPDRLPLERFFVHEISVYRTGINCMEEPGWKNLKAMQQLKESAIRNYFMVRCMYQEAFKPDPSESLKEILDNFPDDKLRCDLESMMPEKLIRDVIRHDVIMKECREKFPGSLALNREKIEPYQVAEIKKLFDDSMLQPGEPVYFELNEEGFGFKHNAAVPPVQEPVPSNP